LLGFPPLPPSQANKKSPMSLRHRAFVSRQTVFRPSVTSAKDAAGYFVGADYLCPRNNPPLCILGSNLVVKTSLKEQPEQAWQFCDRTPTWPRPLLYTLDAARVSMVHGEIAKTSKSPKSRAVDNVASIHAMEMLF